MLRHLINLLLWPLPPTRLFAFRAAMLRLAGVDLREGARVCGRGWIYGRGRLSIGSESWIGPAAIFHTHPDAPIRVGDACDIGPSVEFVTGTHLIGPASRRAGEGSALPITIENGCWVGARVLLIGGVSVGAGAVIAAGSVVRDVVPANSLAAGVPAVVKRALG